MTTKHERIGEFRKLLGKLVRVPKAEVAREQERIDRKRAGKRKK
jgi:hypothetical protein